jgi:DNA-binding GntR family transcriptional regulator
MEFLVKTLTRPKTLTERATEILRKSIINNEFMLGEPLSENLLSENMGISKSPVREALAQLKIEGLVNIIPQKGTFVFTLTLKELFDLTKMRLILESAALKMSYEKNKVGLIDALNLHLKEMKHFLDLNDIDNYLLHDASFHETFFSFCDNQYLIDFYNQISGKSAALRNRISKQPKHPNKTYKEHESIYRNISDGNIDDAIQMIAEHFSSFEQYYIDNIDKIAVSTATSTRNMRKKPSNS